MPGSYGPYLNGNVYTGKTEKEVPPTPAVEEIPPEDGTLTAEEQAAQNTQKLLDAAKNGEEPPPPAEPAEPVAEAPAPADDYNPWVSTSATAYTTSDATALEVAQQHTATYMDSQSKGDVSPDVFKEATDLQKSPEPENTEKGLTALEKTVQELAKDSIQTTKKGKAAAEEQAEAARNAEQNGTATAKKVYTDAERQLLSASALKRVADCKTLIKDEKDRELRKDYVKRLAEAGRLLTQTRKADAKKATATLYRPSETEQGEMAEREEGLNKFNLWKWLGGKGKFSQYNEIVPDLPQKPLTPEKKLAFTQQAVDESHVNPDSSELAALDGGLHEQAGIDEEGNPTEPNQTADNSRGAEEAQNQNAGATKGFNPSEPVNQDAVIADLKKALLNKDLSPETRAAIERTIANMESGAEATVNPDSDLGMLFFGGTGGETNEANAASGERAQKLGAFVYVTEGSARRREREAESRATKVGTGGRAHLTTTSPDAAVAGETKVAVNDRSRADNDEAWNQTTKKGKKDDFVPDDANPAYREALSPQHRKPKGNIWSILFRGEVLKPNLSVAVKNLLPHIWGRN